MKISDVGFVACRECWQCKETKIDDWVGRCVAESKTAKRSHVVTLTYGRDETTGDVDHIKAAVLTYSDVQKYFKYLRADGYPCRYFAVGEYGSLKGRAHWHVIVFWEQTVPQHRTRENFDQKHWPHGYSYWDKASADAVRYACKYILKDPADPDRQSWGPMMSKKPPLGDEYFRRLADQYVEQGLSPQHLFYSFPDVCRIPTGLRARSRKAIEEARRPVRFRMTGKTAENFLSYFIDRWREVYDDEPPRSEPVWAYQGKRLDEYFDSLAQPLFQSQTKGPVPVAPPFEGARVQFCEVANCYYTATAGFRLWYSTDSDGDAGWHVHIKPKLHDPVKTERLWRERGFEPHIQRMPDPTPW